MSCFVDGACSPWLRGSLWDNMESVNCLLPHNSSSSFNHWKVGSCQCTHTRLQRQCMHSFSACLLWESAAGRWGWSVSPCGVSEVCYTVRWGVVCVRNSLCLNLLPLLCFLSKAGRLNLFLLVTISDSILACPPGGQQHRLLARLRVINAFRLHRKDTLEQLGTRKWSFNHFRWIFLHVVFHCGQKVTCQTLLQICSRGSATLESNEIICKYVVPSGTQYIPRLKTEEGKKQELLPSPEILFVFPWL